MSMAPKHARWLWGIAFVLLLVWAVTLTALYAQERKKNDNESTFHGEESLSLELQVPSLALETRPKERRVFLHLEKIEWHGLVRIRQDGRSKLARKIQRDWIVDMINNTLVGGRGTVPIALYEVPSLGGQAEPATVHSNFTIVSVLERLNQEDGAELSVELLMQQPPGGNLQEYTAIKTDRLDRPSTVEFYIRGEHFPQLLSCLEDVHLCAPMLTRPTRPPLLLGDPKRCTPRLRYDDDSFPLDSDAIGRQAFSTALGLLSMIPAAGKVAKAIDVTTKLIFVFTKKKESQDDKWVKMRKYVEKYVAAEVAHAIDLLKINNLENAMTGISRSIESYYLYENGTEAKAIAFQSVKSNMEAWYGFFTSKTNPLGSFVHFIAFGNMYLSWRLQEILSYEDIYGTPLSPQSREAWVNDLEATVKDLQSVVPAIQSQALALRKQAIRFEKKTGYFHCERPPLPWKVTCGNIKVIDDSTGWRSKAYFYQKDSEEDEKYHFAHTLLYNLAVRLATFNLQLKLDDYLDASDWWSFMVPDNPFQAENVTQIYHTGLIGNLRPKAEYIDENYTTGSNLTRLSIFSNGFWKELDGLQLWFDGKTRGSHGPVTSYSQVQEMAVTDKDPLDKLCGIYEASSFTSLKFSNNNTFVGFGDMQLGDFYEGWFFDFDTSATLQKTSVCGMRLGLFGRTKETESVDTMNIAFCKQASKVRRKSS